MNILGLFLTCIVAAIAVVAATIIYFLFTLRRAAKRFMGSTTGNAAGQQSTGQQTHARGQKVSTADMGNEEIYDTRSRHDMQKKIFPKDEGEYVDFEDVH